MGGPRTVAMKLAPAIDGVAPPAESWSRATAILTLLAVLVFVSLIWFGASGGLRGDDQYLYVADVESLITGRGVQTNEIYPPSARYNVAPLPRPFIHNILQVYVAAIPATLFGPYAGWIVTNVVASLLTALIVYRTIIRYARPYPAIVASLAYLFLPLTFWLTVQPMADATIAPLVALTVLIYTGRLTYSRWTLLALLAGVLLLCRESFAPLLGAVPLAYVRRTRSRSFITGLGAIGLLGVGVLFWLLKERLFETNISVTYGQVLLNGMPDHLFGQMVPFFDLSGQSQSVQGFFAKAMHSLYRQFFYFDLAFLAVYLPFNLMLIILLVLVLNSKQAELHHFIEVAVFYVFITVLTVLIVMNQFRYLIQATPPLVVAAGIALGRFHRFRTARISTAHAILALALAATLGIVMSWRVRDYGLQESKWRNSLAVVVEEALPDEETVMVALPFAEKKINAGPLMPMGYVLRPRSVLYVSDQYSSEDYAALITNVNAKWLIARRSSPVFDRLAPRVVREVRALPFPYAEWSVFSIENKADAAVLPHLSHRWRQRSR